MKPVEGSRFFCWLGTTSVSKPSFLQISKYSFFLSHFTVRLKQKLGSESEILIGTWRNYVYRISMSVLAAMNGLLPS